MGNEGRKFFCVSCGQESLVKIVTRYDGFTPAGEMEVCAFCGADSPGEIPSESGLPEGLRREGPRRVCYLCAEYVLNPFVQKCSLTGKEVEALDLRPFPGPPAPGGPARAPGYSRYFLGPPQKRQAAPNWYHQ